MTSRSPTTARSRTYTLYWACRTGTSLGLSNGHVRGGHLLAGEVFPTLEVIVHESPASLRKTQRPELGLALIDL